MNNQATMEKLQLLRLRGMLKAFQATMENGIKKNYTLDEMLGHLVEAEWEVRKNRKYNRLRLQAKFRYNVVFEEIDLNINRNLDKNEFLRLSDCSWIEKKKNIIITGPSGLGKSFISCGLGNQACLYDYKVLYFNCMKLFSKLKQAHADDSDEKLMKKLCNCDLLIIDDFGLQGFDHLSRLKLFEIFDDRHGLKSTLIVSQIPVSKWHQIIGDETIADAICERMVHISIKINLKGEAVRKNQVNNA